MKYVNVDQSGALHIHIKQSSKKGEQIEARHRPITPQHRHPLQERLIRHSAAVSEMGRSRVVLTALVCR